MNFFGFFGRKKPMPPHGYIDLRERCGTWRVGDLAWCIDDGWPRDVPGPHPVHDEIYRVVSVHDEFSDESRRVRAMWLKLKGFNCAYRADCFRKVVQSKDMAGDRNEMPDWLARLRAKVSA